MGLPHSCAEIITPSGVWTVNGLNFGAAACGCHRSFDDGCPSDSGSAVNSAGDSYYCAQGFSQRPQIFQRAVPVVSI
jgi:hypothetical protein